MKVGDIEKQVISNYTRAGHKLQQIVYKTYLGSVNGKPRWASPATEAKKVKEHNTKILTLISEKKDDELKGKSVKELEKMLK